MTEKEVSVGLLAEMVEGQVGGDGEVMVSGFAALESA